MKYLLFSLFFLLLVPQTLRGGEGVAHVFVGGGYYDARSRFSGAHFQAEYRFPHYFFGIIRPQLVAITPRFESAFIGLGIGTELKAGEHLMFVPSFTPGLYDQGKGRNLGFPVEFRSCIEVAFERTSGTRISFQFYHISNASLGNKNPGANAWALMLGIPLKKR